MLQKLRERMGREEGFTLVELLVVMLIIGILAAIAIPSFFNQRDKARDADAKSDARTAQTAMETYSTDNNGSYAGASLGALQNIESALGGITATVSGTLDTYSIGVTQPQTGNVFTIAARRGRCDDAELYHRGDGGCPTGGNWGN